MNNNNHPQSCAELNPKCPYLYIPHCQRVNPDRVKMIICRYLNIPLNFVKEKGDWIKTEITDIKPDWDCPFWQQGRKEGKYSNTQTSIDNVTKS